mgnify:CR=1 FL=1
MRRRRVRNSCGVAVYSDGANPAHPAGDTLQMVVSHEMGHFFGLMAHSRRCVDVMSYYDNGQGERCFTRAGRPLPTRGDDRVSEAAMEDRKREGYF